MIDLLLSFYGDDFTGSTDVMEALSLGGVPAVLFMTPPSRDMLSRKFPNIRAVGVPGVSRSLNPLQMREELPPIFATLAALGAQSFHYKVCSTFDSAPEIGSIGQAIEIARAYFDSPYIPLLVGAPALGRYTLFGNLFARIGDTTYRLDRHPTMSKHPITPMDESDLRVHLAEQTAMHMCLFDVFNLTGSPDEVDERFVQTLNSGADIVLFDVFDEERLREAGRLIWSHRRPRLMVGSSGIEYALTSHWQRIRLVQAPTEYTSAVPVEQIFVVSGSCSPGTAAQIRWALARGFMEVALDTPGLVDPAVRDATRAASVASILSALSAGSSVIAHAALGPDDARIPKTKERLASVGMSALDTGELIGRQLGAMLGEVLERTGLRRAVVTGGDTSGHAVRQLKVYALELVTPIAPGAPLCRCNSTSPLFDGLELSLKGGQNGREDYFGRILAGSSAPV